MLLLHVFEYKRFFLVTQVSVQALSRSLSLPPLILVWYTSYSLYSTYQNYDYLLTYWQLWGRQGTYLVPAVAPTPKEGLAHS